MDTLHIFVAQCGIDLELVRAALVQTYRDRSVAALASLPSHALYTAVGTLLLVNVLVACCSRHGRKMLVDIVDTTVAIFLILFLLAIVLGLPIGEMLNDA